MGIKVKADRSGVDRLIANLEGAEKKLEDRLLDLSKELAEEMRGDAASMLYGPDPFLEWQTGETGDSIAAYAEKTENGISFGVSTNNLRTIYHEMGTGPVGTTAGYPGEENLDEPIVRRSTGWSYYSEKIPLPDGGKRSGFVKTEGTPPKAFMHNAVMNALPSTDRRIQALVKEVLSGK